MAKNGKTKKAPARKKAAKKASPGAGDLARLTKGIREEVWPNERQTLFRPERLRYVRKLIKPEGCVFCEAVRAGVSPESLLLYKDERAIVVMNKFPYNTGHLLILPRRHCGDFTQLSKGELVALTETLQLAVKALTEVFHPDGFNVGLNLGSAAGAGIPEHLHYHVIPRWSGDTNFFPLVAETKVVIETLETSFQKLLPHFQSAHEKGAGGSKDEI